MDRSVVQSASRSRVLPLKSFSVTARQGGMGIGIATGVAPAIGVAAAGVAAGDGGARAAGGGAVLGTQRTGRCRPAASAANPTTVPSSWMFIAHALLSPNVLRSSGPPAQTGA